MELLNHLASIKLSSYKHSNENHLLYFKIFQQTYPEFLKSIPQFCFQDQKTTIHQEPEKAHFSFFIQIFKMISSMEIFITCEYRILVH